MCAVSAAAQLGQARTKRGATTTTTTPQKSRQPRRISLALFGTRISYQKFTTNTVINNEDVFVKLLVAVA